jgi:hypothetical protein
MIERYTATTWRVLCLANELPLLCPDLQIAKIFAEACSPEPPESLGTIRWKSAYIDYRLVNH